MKIKKNYSATLLFCFTLTNIIFTSEIENQVILLIERSIQYLDILTIERTYTRKSPYYNLRRLLQAKAKNTVEDEQTLATQAYQLLLSYPIFQAIKEKNHNKTPNNLYLLAIACQKQTTYELLGIIQQLGIIAHMGIQVHNQHQKAIRNYNEKQLKSRLFPSKCALLK